MAFLLFSGNYSDRRVLNEIIILPRHEAVIIGQTVIISIKVRINYLIVFDPNLKTHLKICLKYKVNTAFDCLQTLDYTGFFKKSYSTIRTTLLKLRFEF